MNGIGKGIKRCLEKPGNKSSASKNKVGWRNKEVNLKSQS